MTLMGRQPREDLASLVDSSLAVGRPNGLAVKRTTTRGSGPGTRRRRDVRALVFTDSVLDYLVHLHMLPGPKGGTDANIVSFLAFLREDYGLHVDTEPPGVTISNEILGRNRAVLERRLRDLGLLIGVNDAERMKRLTPPLRDHRRQLTWRGQHCTERSSAAPSKVCSAGPSVGRWRSCAAWRRKWWPNWPST